MPSYDQFRINIGFLFFHFVSSRQFDNQAEIDIANGRAHWAAREYTWRSDCLN